MGRGHQHQISEELTKVHQMRLDCKSPTSKSLTNLSKVDKPQIAWSESQTEKTGRLQLVKVKASLELIERLGGGASDVFAGDTAFKAPKVRKKPSPYLSSLASTSPARRRQGSHWPKKGLKVEPLVNSLAEPTAERVG